MAETTEGTVVVEEGSTKPAESAPAVLSQEERDNATIAKLLGGQKEPDPKPAAKAPEAEETKPDAVEENPETTASEEDEESADDEPEITDEDLETILDALDDRILNHPRMAKILEDRAKADADRRIEESRRTSTESQESERLITVGRTAAEKLYELFGKAGEQLVAAAKGEEFEKVVLDPEDFKSNMRDYGAAVTLITRREFDNAFTDGFTAATQIGGALTPEESETITELVNTARRIEQDPKQGSQAAKNHLFIEGMKFLTERAKAAGKSEAEAAVQKKRDALKKIVGDGGQNAVTAATAKLAKERKGLPPKPTKGEPESVGVANMDAYRKLKTEGKYDEADQVLQQISIQKAQGRQVS